MGAVRKYPDELRDRAVRLVLGLVKDQEASVTPACRKVGGELGIKADTLLGWAKQAQVDRGMRRGPRRRMRRGSGRCGTSSTVRASRPPGCTVERLMRRLGLRGVRRGGWKEPRTTVPDPSQDRRADLVNRDFAPPAPDRLWVVDFTFVATWAGTAYTALVIDAFDRLTAGWRTAASHSTDLVLDALVMAVTCREVGE